MSTPTATPTPRASAGINYRRLAAITVMDAYSGETTLYVPDPDEPMTRTWRSAYPSLFTDFDEMPDDLLQHVRYGEDLFDFQARAVEFFHLDPARRPSPDEVRGNAEIFFNGDEAWAPTEEVYGAGVQGERIVSPARFTFAVLPGRTTEEFLAIRSYKPRVQGRGHRLHRLVRRVERSGELRQADHSQVPRPRTSLSTRWTLSPPTSRATPSCRRS